MVAGALRSGSVQKVAAVPVLLVLAACGAPGTDPSGPAAAGATGPLSASVSAGHPGVVPSRTASASAPGRRRTPPVPTAATIRPAAPTASPGGASASPGAAAAILPLPAGAIVVGGGTAAGCTESALRAATRRMIARGGGTVSFSCGPAPATIAMSAPLTITGAGSARYVFDGRNAVTLDGGNATGLVELPDSAGLSAAFRNLGFVRARTGTQGAAIHGGWRNRITIEGCRFSDNRSTAAAGDYDGGGAVYVHEGSAAVRGSTFLRNTAHNGGAIQNTIGDVVVENSTFRGNRSLVRGKGGGGGAIYSDSGRLVVRSSTISANTAMLQGGGLFIWNAKDKLSRIENSDLEGNTVTDAPNAFGGAIRNGSGPLVIVGTTIRGNVSAGQGGGLYNADDAVVTVTGSTFTRNRAAQGGAIMRVSGTITTTRCRFSENTPADVR